MTKTKMKLPKNLETFKTQIKKFIHDEEFSKMEQWHMRTIFDVLHTNEPTEENLNNIYLVLAIYEKLFQTKELNHNSLRKLRSTIKNYNLTLEF